MKVEITLHIKEGILREAEEYARKYNRSLTKVIEASLNRLVMDLPELDESQRSPEMKQLLELLDTLPEYDGKENEVGYEISDY